MPDAKPVCSCCGEEHEAISFSFAANFPDAYASLSVEDREARASQDADRCTIDQEQFYIRGCLEIPIRGADDVFLWGVWARVDRAVFDAVAENWDTDGREAKIGPYEGRLANALAIYPKTLDLPVSIEIKPVGTRPHFRVDAPDHSLGIEQRYGITPEHAQEYACWIWRAAKS